MMLSLAEIRRILDGGYESTMCNYDENDKSSHHIRLSPHEVRKISDSLVRVERLLALLMEDWV